MSDVCYGPAGWEDQAPRRYGPVGRVAVVSDVHTNVAALTAVLADIEAAGPDLIVSCGDLTWGSQPDETVALMRDLGDRALFVRGNGERAVLEISSGQRTPERPREAWVPGRHSASSLGFVAAIPFSIVIDITGLGPVRFCHGSPRSDTELVTLAIRASASPSCAPASTSRFSSPGTRTCSSTGRWRAAGRSTRAASGSPTTTASLAPRTGRCSGPT